MKSAKSPSRCRKNSYQYCCEIANWHFGSVLRFILAEYKAIYFALMSRKGKNVSTIFTGTVQIILSYVNVLIAELYTNINKNFIYTV